MQITADSWFSIGKPHVVAGSPCEDYALSGEISGISTVLFAIVSDGCSGAYANTDIGARTWAHAAKRRLGDLISGSDLVEEVRTRNITDDISDLAATLLVLQANTQKTTVQMWGDGCVFAQTKDGKEFLWECEWNDEMPFYLQYLLNPSWMRSFRQAHKAKEFPFVVKKTTIKNEEIFKQEELLSIESAIKGWTLELPSENLSKIAIFSDGISKIDGFTTWEAAKEATNFKNTTGSFLKRRMIRFQQNCEKEGRTLKDDLSVASLVFLEE